MITPAFAEESRELDAHEHGVGALNIAFEGDTVAMEFTAPGADIVGFEYAAESTEDRAAIDDAVAILAKPLDLFVLPAAAECTVVQASASLESEDDHEEHAESHDEHEHEHEEKHADAHDEHAHEDEAHEEHAHDEHAHDKDEASHTEFHAEYTLKCGDPAAISEITFAYFETFENALELEVQIVSDAGAKAFEVMRESPTLDLRGMF